MMRKLWYFGLEPLKERYTEQLSQHWFPDTFVNSEIEFMNVKGLVKNNTIKIGSVLDAEGRGVYAMNQCQNFMKSISDGLVNQNDIVYLQDFWTPGFESVIYMLELYGIKVDIYSMLHAQSVDEYDFTHAMKKWMRHFELGLDSLHKGIFVGSTVHKEQLRQAGFKSPIHVVGLPFNFELAYKDLQNYLDEKNYTIPQRCNQIIYTSRFDKEKNPFFMLDVAEKFLQEKPDYKWIVTTSADKIKSSIPGFVDYIYDFEKKHENFIIKEGLSKGEYYFELKKSKIQFNSALQDYVSWTLIESTYFGCDIVYPDFRSFPEIINSNRLYKAFDLRSSIERINHALDSPCQHYDISKLCDLGRKAESFIMLNDVYNKNLEFNIWHESSFIEKLINKEIKL